MRNLCSVRVYVALAVAALLAPVAAAAPTRVAGCDAGSKGIRGVVLEYDPDAPAKGVSVLFSKVTNPTAGLTKDGKLVPAQVADAADDLAAFVKVFTDEYGVKRADIQLVGSAAFADPDSRAVLAEAVEKTTKLKMSFLSGDSEEARLTIEGLALLGKRSRGLVIDVGGGTSKGGIATGDGVTTFGLSFGSVSFANRVREAQKAKPGPFGEAAARVRDDELLPAVRKALAGKPLASPAVAVTGGIAFACATLLHPDQAGAPTVTLTLADFRTLIDRLGRDPLKFPQVDTMKISDPTIRAKAEADVRTLRDIYNAENLLSGATVVLAIGDELKLDGKPLTFVRDAQYAWIVARLVPETVKKAVDKGVDKGVDKEKPVGPQPVAPPPMPPGGSLPPGGIVYPAYPGYGVWVSGPCCQPAPVATGTRRFLFRRR